MPENDLDDAGSVNYFTLVSWKYEFFAFFSLFPTQTIYLLTQFLVSICKEMGLLLDCYWYYIYRIQIVGDAIIYHRLWWIHNIADRSNTWNRNNFIYINLTVVWWRKNTVSKTERFDLIQFLRINSISERFKFILFQNSRTNATVEENRQEIKNDSIAYAYFMTLTTLVHFMAGIICVDSFNHSALRQISRIRVKFFESLMRQEIGWYDVDGSSHNFAVRATE